MAGPCTCLCFAHFSVSQLPGENLRLAEVGEGSELEVEVAVGQPLPYTPAARRARLIVPATPQLRLLGAVFPSREKELHGHYLLPRVGALETAPSPACVCQGALERKPPQTCACLLTSVLRNLSWRQAQSHPLPSTSVKYGPVLVPWLGL